ncbi:hypothetical protein ACFL6C_06290 [Myxococcota bacterium]
MTHRWAVPIACTVFLVSCQSTALPTRIDSPIQEREWRMLADKAIYFGHQSVGANILDGVERLSAGSAAPTPGPKLVQSSAPEDLTAGVWMHEMIGENERPDSKISAFKDRVQNGVGERADIAFFKLCYIDINEQTNVPTLFDSYRATLESLKQQFQNTVFVHVTMPITVVQSGPRAWVKGVLGRRPWGEVENVGRSEFNQLMRTHFKEDPIFDLARLESTGPGGERHIYWVDSRPIEKLVPAYTSDGGHLNDTGRLHLARSLIRFLGELPSSDATAP